MTPKNLYWRLIKTLYGLKRSPRHWFEQAKTILESVGLLQLKNALCVFYGHIRFNLPPIYVAIYIDDFIYFSKSDEAERLFKTEFSKEIKTACDSIISHFLGIAFNCTKNEQGDVSIKLSQEAFAEMLLERFDMAGPNVHTVATPYRSGCPVDKIPNETYDPITQAKINHKLQQATGCFQWLATSTRPDLATITNMLAQYTHNASKGHLERYQTYGN